MPESNAQVILVAGGTDGLGRAAAVRCAKEGYRVFAAGRSPDKLSALRGLAREQGLALTPVEMDVTDDASVARGVAQVESEAGPVDILVNCAGVAVVVAMEEISMADLKRQFEINFFGAVRVIQRVLPKMRERGRGKIINTSSVSGRMAVPLFGPYSGSKFALEGMSDALRLELYPFGVKVVLIEPGYIRTNIEKASTEISGAYHMRAPEGPYARVYANFQKTWNRMTAPIRTRPEEFAEVVLRIIRETHPRARYGVAGSANRVGWIRRLFTDRMLDRRVLKQFELGP